MAILPRILFLIAILSASLANSSTITNETGIIADDPEPQTFEVFAGNANESTRGRGMIGGGGYYHAVLTIAPRYELPGDGTARIILDGERVTANVVERQDPGGFALLTWSFDLMDMDNPARLVRRVSAVFDNGETIDAETAPNGIYSFPIPAGASRLVRFRVAWSWGQNSFEPEFEAQGETSLLWFLLLPLLLGSAGAAAWWLRPRQAAPRPEGDKEPGRLSLRLPDVERERPELLLGPYELSADEIGDSAQPLARTRVLLRFSGEGAAPPSPAAFRLSVRSPAIGQEGPGNAAAAGTLFMGGAPLGDTPVTLGSGEVELELRCEPRAEGWTVVGEGDARQLQEVLAATYAVVAESLDGIYRAESPPITIVHGAPASLSLADSPAALGMKLSDLTGPNGKPLALNEPVGTISGAVFQYSRDSLRPLGPFTLRLGAEGIPENEDAAKKKRIPMATAALLLFVVRDRAGNPVRLLEDDGRGFYRPSFRITHFFVGGLRPFFLTAGGRAEDVVRRSEEGDLQATEWVAQPSPTNVLPVGAYGALMVGAGFDVELLSFTGFAIRIEKVADRRASTVLEQSFTAYVAPTPYPTKWGRWLFEGEVEDAATFIAEIGLSLIPIVGDGRDLILYAKNELSGREMGVLDRLVALLALAGLILDIANVLSAGSTAPADAAVGALKASGKLLRRLADPSTARAVWRSSTAALGREASEILGSKAARVEGREAAAAALRLGEALYERFLPFLELARRDDPLLDSDAFKTLNDTLQEFDDFRRAVSPILTDVDKLKALLSLMGMALLTVQLGDLLALFARRKAEEVMDLLAALIVMSELEVPQYG